MGLETLREFLAEGRGWGGSVANINCTWVYYTLHEKSYIPEIEN